jgi:hypothetical protein
MRLGPLLLAPLLVLTSAAPTPDRYWFSIADADGVEIGFGYVEGINSSEGGASFTTYREAMVRRTDGSTMRVTDRIVETDGQYARPREIFERVEMGSDWTEYRGIVGSDEAVITRTTAAGQETVRAKVPPERLYGQSVFGGGRCDTGERLELTPAAMGLERVVNLGPPAGSGALSAFPAKHYRGDKPYRVDQNIYDGDCRWDSLVTTFGGQQVTVRHDPDGWKKH